MISQVVLTFIGAVFLIEMGKIRKELSKVKL